MRRGPLSTITVNAQAIAVGNEQANHAHTCQAPDGKLYTLVQNGDDVELHSYDPKTNTDTCELSFLKDVSVTLPKGYTFSNKYGLGASIFAVTVEGTPVLCCYVPIEIKEVDKGNIF